MKNQKRKQIIISFLIIFLTTSAIVAIFHIGHPKVKQKASIKPPVLLPPQPLKIKNSVKTFFASNGKTTVYKIKKGHQQAVILNGKEGKTYDYVSNPTFSADGSLLAYNAEINNQSFVVINNTQEINAYLKASHIAFSPNNQQIAFVATKNDNSSVIISASVLSSLISNISTTSPTTSTQKQVPTTTINYQETNILTNGDILNLSISDSSEITYQVQSENKIITITNNQIVSTIPADSSSSPLETDSTTSGTQSAFSSTTSNTGDSAISNSDSSSDYHYPYAISTQKDIDRSQNQNQLNPSSCDSSSGKQCNF
ncbi:MAG TPA: hypothetical protein ENL05_00130 [Candidatus Moranbacteria bacterium]|nr:hypothetical protein [Candidatus Moranbacteria bacterium]